MQEQVWLESEGVRLAGHLRWPAARSYLPPHPAVVICHGLGSRKERHAEFARFLSGRGFAALALDLRGHGESGGQLDGREALDIGAAVRYLQSRPEVDASRLAVRGSSLGGCCAIHAAATFPEIKAVVAICPAREAGLRSMLIEQCVGEVIEGNGLHARLKLPDYLDYLREHDVFEAVDRISPRALYLIHARGDTTIPYQVSEQLYASAGEPKNLLLLNGGSHWSAQHDPAVHDSVVEWLKLRLGIE